MKKSEDKNPGRSIRLPRVLLFPLSVLVLYGILYALSPGKTVRAFSSSGNIFLSILVPLVLVFVLMLALNLFLKPAHIARFLGREAGATGVLLSAAAGIISMGPIYAWYPLLRELRAKGAGNSMLTIFLGNRAVKPLLLPIMVSYFGWLYVILLTLLTMAGSIGVGYAVGFLVPDQPETRVEPSSAEE